jgi:hypothetical protein
MADPEQLATLKKGVDVWNRWRRDHSAVRLDLRGASLSEMVLRAVDFRRVDLRETNLSGAVLRGSILRNAVLSGADIRQAVLRNADFGGADLSGADLRETFLNGAVLRDAVLCDADLGGARFGSTIVGNVDLSQTKGLNEVTHEGPSTIGIDTIYRSNGEIPESFLRGCGVPDAFITFVRSLVGKAIQFYSCFISYSSQDHGFTERLHADLQAQKLRVWFAPEDLKIGDLFQERIEESIRLYDRVMIVLSEASVQSRWVEREVNAAREREDRENRTVLFPICIDDAVMSAPQPWAADIRRSRHIGDFTGWKDHDSYQKAFQRLLRDLAPGPTAKP